MQSLETQELQLPVRNGVGGTFKMGLEQPSWENLPHILISDLVNWAELTASQEVSDEKTTH